MLRIHVRSASAFLRASQLVSTRSGLCRLTRTHHHHSTRHRAFLFFGSLTFDGPCLAEFISRHRQKQKGRRNLLPAALEESNYSSNYETGTQAETPRRQRQSAEIRFTYSIIALLNSQPPTHLSTG